METKKSPKNILLISPTSKAEVAQVKWLSPPLGIIRLASFLNANGHKAEYIDTNFYLALGQENFLENKLKEKDWDIIGFSILDESIITDFENIYLAKKICPKAFLVAGGIEAQFNYQTILDKTPCKVVILGEGELPLLLLANEAPFEKIPGIVMRNNAIPFDKNLFQKATELIEWEKISYEAYWDFYVKKYQEKGQLTEQVLDQIHTVRIFTRNRCGMKCKFCSSTNQLTWAAQNEAIPTIDVITEENQITGLIERIKGAHPRLRTIYFSDDDFLANPAAAIKFCQIISEKNLGLRFICLARVDKLSEEVVSWLAKANFKVLNIGIESFSQKVLDEFSKKYNTAIVQEKINLLKKYKIHPFISLILISPESSLDDVETTVDKTAEYIKDGQVTASIALSCMPLKGSVFNEEYFDFMTEVVSIPGTDYKIKRNINILASNPYVRESQLIFYRGIGKEIERRIKEEGIAHATSANQARFRLEFMKKIISEIRQKYGIKFGESPDIRTEKSELMASQALYGVEGDKFQGI
jgi:anaerobic magnesium-protoporphyrin IX monomethyl ester cyclase